MVVRSAAAAVDARGVDCTAAAVTEVEAARAVAKVPVEWKVVVVMVMAAATASAVASVEAPAVMVVGVAWAAMEGVVMEMCISRSRRRRDQGIV